MESRIENEALFKLTYGLFVLSARDGDKDNGCIVNTVSLITDKPKRITVYVNKLNYTEQMIKKTGILNVSVLTESAPFELFKQFGFQSGRDTNKFEGKEYPRSENGIYYLTEHVNAVISAKVVDALDYGTHTLFVAEVTEAKVLSAEKSVTYEYYFAHIKPKPAETKKAAESGSAEAEKKMKRWICKICGFVYEGEYLPEDYICPLCKHGIEDFDPLPA